jgi:putative transcriptional regulator
VNLWKGDWIMINEVRALREQRKLTQQQLGELVGVSRQSIVAIEKGKYDPTLWVAYDLAKVFGITIEELFDFEGGERK